VEKGRRRRRREQYEKADEERDETVKKTKMDGKITSRNDKIR
jgi:hypothetical protein